MIRRKLTLVCSTAIVAALIGCNMIVGLDDDFHPTKEEPQDTCNECLSNVLLDECLTEFNLCNEDPDCSAFVACPEPYDQCKAQYPAGEQLFVDLVYRCSCDECPQCGCSAPTSCDDVGVCGDGSNGCLQCATAGNCNDELLTCNNNADCVSFSDCIADCATGDEACFDTCMITYPTGSDLYANLAFCVICDECYVSCDGASSGCP